MCVCVCLVKLTHLNDLTVNKLELIRLSDTYKFWHQPNIFIRTAGLFSFCSNFVSDHRSVSFVLGCVVRRHSGETKRCTGLLAIDRKLFSSWTLFFPDARHVCSSWIVPTGSMILCECWKKGHAVQLLAYQVTKHLRNFNNGTGILSHHRTFDPRILGFETHAQNTVFTVEKYVVLHHVTSRPSKDDTGGPGIVLSMRDVGSFPCQVPTIYNSWFVWAWQTFAEVSQQRLETEATAQW